MKPTPSEMITTLLVSVMALAVPLIACSLIMGDRPLVAADAYALTIWALVVLK